MEKVKIAIVGATGLVGQTFLQILQEQKTDEYELKLFASKISEGKRVKYNKKYYYIHKLDEHSFDDVDYALFFTLPEISKVFVPIALRKNVKVIDNSPYFRMKEDVKLVAYSVNDNLIDEKDKLIANPNCCAVQACILLNVLKQYGIKRIDYSTYQSVSGSGKSGIDDLLRCRKGLMPLLYETDISFSCIPKIGMYLENGFTDEENKLIEETKKIMEQQDIEIYATCVRVPVMFSHGIAMQVELSLPFKTSEIKNQFKNYENIVVCENVLPSSVLSCKNDKVYVGRIRKKKQTLLLYCVADNIRVGAATNAFLILKRMINLKRSQNNG